MHVQGSEKGKEVKKREYNICGCRLREGRISFTLAATQTGGVANAYWGSGAEAVGKTFVGVTSGNGGVARLALILWATGHHCSPS